jgi:hypothetical protein
MTQAAFRTALLDPDRPVPPGLADANGRSAGRRFDVYRNNVAVGLTDALRSYFPVVDKLVGTEFFTAMAGVFLRAHPPVSPVLLTWGDAFPEFVTEFAPAASVPYLSDVARLELAIRSSYHAADARSLAPDALAAVPPESLGTLILTLAPATRLVRSEWPIFTIWAANTLDTPPPKTKSAEDVLVLRPEFDPRPVLLPPGGAAFVSAVMSGAPLEVAAFAAGDAFDLAGMFSILIAHGAIVSLTE